MGKDSLIKSTTTKSGQKKATSPKSTRTKSAGAQGRKTSGTKKSTKSSPKKSTKKAPTRNLLLKQFVSRKKPSSAPSPDYSAMTAPPLIDTGDPAEDARLRTLLQKRFDMAAIKAAARPPAENRTDQEPAPMADEIAPAPPIEHVQAEAAEPLEEPQASAPPAATSQDEPAEPAKESPQESTAERDDISQEPPSRSGDGSGQIPPETTIDNGDPVQRAAKIGLAVLAFLIFLIVWASASNSFKYFMVPADGFVEVWKGDFSPAGKRFVAVLHGVRLDDAKEFYRREDVFPMMFTYYITKADALLDVEGLPDYRNINDYLQRAERFALNDEMHNAVDIRRNTIRRLSLLYKADIDTDRGTAASLQSALESLREAQQLTTDASQAELIDRKMTLINERLAAAEEGVD